MSRRMRWFRATAIGAAISGTALGGYLAYLHLSAREAFDQVARTVTINTESEWLALADFAAVQEGVADWAIDNMTGTSDGRVTGQEAAVLGMIQKLITPKMVVELVGRVYGRTELARKESFAAQSDRDRRNIVVSYQDYRHIEISFPLKNDPSKAIFVALDRHEYWPGSDWRVVYLELPRSGSIPTSTDKNGS